MSYPNRSIFLSPTEQDRIRTLLGAVKPINEFLSSAVEKLQDGKGWAESLTAAAPWLKDVAEAAGTAIPIVGAAVKLFSKWLEQTHPFELGAVACTLAYQQASAAAIERHWTSAINFGAVKKVDNRIAQQLRDAAPVEAIDLSTFTRSAALQHPFVKHADELLSEMLRGVEADEELRRRILDHTHREFENNLDLLLTDKKTAEKFAPFKEWMELDAGRRAAHAALQLHAKYQRDQYESEPLFRREPYALKNIYIDTECGKLTWGEIRGKGSARRRELPNQPSSLDPFSENHGQRHDLLTTVMDYLTEPQFKEAIVIQGVAGAGKSSFTLRLCSELWANGFQPIRIRLKRLHLTGSLFDALNEAIELADAAAVPDLPVSRPDDLLLKGDIFKTPWGGNSALCRYVVILDGWDELDLSDSKSFKEKVESMLREVRHRLLDEQRKPRVRVVITGRPSPDVTESRFLQDDTPVLTMRPIRPEQLRKFVDDLSDAVGMTPPYVAVKDWERWSVPHSIALTEAFNKYEAAFNASLPEYDEAGKMKRAGQPPDSASLEVLGLPLLTYLTIRVMAEVVAGGGSLEAQQAAINEMIENPTLLYRRLLDLTCEKAGKAQIDERDSSSEIEQRQAREVGNALRERLRRTAAAMSVLGVEHISRAEWEKRVPQEKTKQAERRTSEAEDHPLARLMISFYFKGGQPEQGCEFAHKSFREYLFAECIVETMKIFGRGLTQRDVERWPTRNVWRDFSREEDRNRYDFSRNLSELLAPQWITWNVRNHLLELIQWEIERSFADAETAPPSQLKGLPTAALTRAEWGIVRDGLADLWAWWCDGAHLRPQIKTDYGERAEVKQAYVESLIRRAAPQTRDWDETLELESSTSIDAHLGDGLFQLCAWTHYQIAKADGWLAPRDATEDVPTPEQLWEGVTAKKVYSWELFKEKVIGEGDAPHPFQAAIVQSKESWRVFAPSGPDAGLFQRCIARINAAEGHPMKAFPLNITIGPLDLRGASLDGASLDGARLDGASLNRASLDRARLYGASLDRARLDGARLDGARLDGARFLTLAQLESAWIDEQTQLPDELEPMKSQLLERQQQQIVGMNAGSEETDSGEMEEEGADEE
jgi:hypothetical protein